MKKTIPTLHLNNEQEGQEKFINLESTGLAGKMESFSLSRGNFGGPQLPDGVLEGILTIGYLSILQNNLAGVEWFSNDALGFLFLESGEMPLYMKDSDQKVSDHMLKPGQLLINRPSQPNKLGDPFFHISKFTWLMIDIGYPVATDKWRWPDWIVLSAKDQEELASLLRNSEQQIWPTDAELKRIFHQLAIYIKSDTNASSESPLKVYINELLIRLLELLRKGDIGKQADLPPTLLAANNFLQALPRSLQDPWTLESMAAACGLGVTRFVYYCRQLTNMTPMQYLRNVRLQEAIRLLQTEPPLSISDIAYKCGFSSSQYFATTFRKHYGLTPQEWRASLPFND